MKKYLIILLTLFLFSCSSRKVETEKKDIKEVTKIDSIDKIVEKTNIKIDTKKDIEESELVFTPIDNTKEFIVNNKRYKNVQISNIKKKDNTIIAESKTIDKNQDIAVKKAVNSKLQSNVKSVDKKGLPIIAKIGILLGLILLFVGGSYLYIRK
jgi:PBP1b-binding outer membrane lipoprotein LpoB